MAGYRSITFGDGTTRWSNIGTQGYSSVSAAADGNSAINLTTTKYLPAGQIVGLWVNSVAGALLRVDAGGSGAFFVDYAGR